MANAKCGDDKKFADHAKKGVKAKADNSDFAAQCCTMKGTCTAFKGANIGGGGNDASTAARQLAATVSLFFALGGGLVMSGF